MIPELQVPAQKAALLVKTLGRPIISLGNDRHLMHALRPEPVNRSENQVFSNASPANLRTDPDQTDLPFPADQIQVAGDITQRLIGHRGDRKSVV